MSALGDVGWVLVCSGASWCGPGVVLVFFVYFAVVLGRLDPRSRSSRQLCVYYDLRGFKGSPSEIKRG